MAYDEFIGERITSILKTKNVSFYSKKMMGGLIFMVDEKMFCGIHTDKTLQDTLLMARIGEEAYDIEIKKEICISMNFTGRPMKGYIYVKPEGIDLDSDLEYWIERCLEFNPLAKSSIRKKQ